MNFDNRAVIIGVNVRDLHNPRSAKHFFADVVLIDKSNTALHPLLYQLKNDALHSTHDLSQFKRDGYLSIDHNAFAMMGQVLSIDKNKKQIYLQNEDTVSYKHLVLASGLSQTNLGAVHDEEINSGFHALTEALRVKKNADQLLNPSFFKHLGFRKIKSAKASLSKDDCEATIENLVRELSSNFPPSRLSLTIASHRLYEVQL